MRTPIFAFAFLLLAPSSYGAEASDIAACAALYDDTARLQCFDGIAAADGISPRLSEVETTNTGKWRTTSSVNPLDDSTTVALVLAADTGTNRFGAPITLILRCQSGRVDTYINWSEYLGDNSTPTLRTDDEPARQVVWRKSSDSVATFAPSGRSFLESIIYASRLVAQITPYSESPRTAVFDLTGIEEASKPLWSACGIAPPVDPQRDNRVSVKAGSIMCSTASTYNAAIRIEQAAPSREEADYGPACFLLGEHDREFERTRVSAGATIVKRPGGLSYYTANENIE